MRIIAERDFISSIFGNVTTGQVLEAEQKMADHLVLHGLAKVIEQKVKKNEIEVTKEPDGVLSQVDQVLPKKIVKKSVNGKKKAKKTK